MSDLMTLPQLVEIAFDRAVDDHSVAHWHSVALMAGCAAVMMAAEGHDFHAAALDGVAEEAKRREHELEKVAA